jgi:RNA polymerase sigma-54 factor
MYRSLKGEEKAYLKDKIQRVSLLQRSITQREQMITSLTAYVVQRQENFFQRGEGNLTSLRMQDAADILKVHVSTISRAVNGKYLQCEWGIYPLKYFFTQGKEDGPVRTDLRKLIRQMIREENKEQPLSDSMIERKLKEKGIEIARRTVAKYRKAEGIPDVYKRKIN